MLQERDQLIQKLIIGPTSLSEEYMTIIWISCIIIANVCVYIRKVILMQSGYKAGLFLSRDFKHLSDLLGHARSPKHKYIADHPPIPTDNLKKLADIIYTCLYSFQYLAWKASLYFSKIKYFNPDNASQSISVLDWFLCRTPDTRRAWFNSSLLCTVQRY